MNIDKMSKWQKTVHIINLIPDWSIWGMGEDGDDIVLQIGGKETAVLRAPDYIFAPKWMFLAWRVLNWAHGNLGTLEKGEVRDYFSAAWNGPIPEEFHWFFGKSPAEAQRLWLDKIVQLAIEAGMVEDTAVPQEPTPRK